MERFVDFYYRKIHLWIEKKHVVYLVLGLMITAVFLLLVKDTLFGSQAGYRDRQVIMKNIGRLQTMEQRVPADMKSLLKKEKTKDSETGKMETKNRKAGNTDVEKKEKNGKKTEEKRLQEKEQKKIMTMKNPDISVFNQWFDGCALLGDSIAESAGEYGFLNSSILFAKIGCSVVKAGDLVTSMERVYPNRIFLAFGMNDMENYGSHVDRFLEHYRELIAKIRKKLPDSAIYVSAILPVEKKAISKNSKLKNRSLYNESLETLCSEMDLNFIDPGFILEQDSSFFEPDGIHAKASFYYKWLTYLADEAGISE